MDDIKEITLEEANKLWNSSDDLFENYVPQGLFYVANSNEFIGIDNSNGHAWTKIFNNSDECKAWLEEAKQNV